MISHMSLSQDAEKTDSSFTLALNTRKLKMRHSTSCSFPLMQGTENRYFTVNSL